MDKPTFILGFKTLAELIGEQIVGEPLENERHNAENGDALQATTKGLMVWRKADNWTAFTDGYRTWVNGPFGLQERLNTERFDWEADYQPPQPDYAPRLLDMPLSRTSERYPYLLPPRGFLLHGTGTALAHADTHDRERLGAGQHMRMAGARVIGMAMGNHRTLNGTGRVNEKSAGKAE